MVALGFFPWAGFIPGALRATLGGWARRNENADHWFFAVWAGFIFVFFSASQSKLPPYVLPVFPPLAALVGAGLARTMFGNTPTWVKGGFVAFGIFGGLLAGAIVLAVFRPALTRMDGSQAVALQPFALALAGILVSGGFASVWLIQRKGLASATVGLLTTTRLFLATLAFASEKIQRASTRERALFASATLPPTARIFHYHDFFHDFVFYSRRFVGTVEYHGDELELANDSTARDSGRFIDEDTFRRVWTSSERIYVVVRKKKLRDLRRDYDATCARRQKEIAGEKGAATTLLTRPSVLIDPMSLTHLIRETADHYLVSNRGGG